MEKAKKITTAFILILISLMIIPQISIAAPATDLGGIIGTVAPPDPISGNDRAVNIYIGTIINTALFVGLIAALVYIVYGGIRWISAGGDAKALDAARATITQAIVGLILLASGYAISLVFNALVKNPYNNAFGDQPNSVCAAGRVCAGTMICVGSGQGVCQCPPVGTCMY